MRKTLPPETLVLPAWDGADDDPAHSSSQRHLRRTSTARPVSKQDTALVTRQTLIQKALEVVGEDVRAATAEIPALRKPANVDIFEAETAPRTPVAIVPAGKLATTPSWLHPRRPLKKRSLAVGIVTCLMTLGLILGVIEAASPLSIIRSGISPFGLLGAQTAHNTATNEPSGPWETQAGAVLGVGGGAGPGVHAPGSAGLPVKTGSGGNGSTANKPPTSNIQISPPPLSPWPPSWAFTPPPGYHSFGVSRPSNGFYWWAFGQCTWWAQYKRQDENLRYMGNAQYWAGGAAGRGYRVGGTPVPGATVVFQPGVEGAGGAGHVAHVEKVYPGGWFLVSEMNFYWNGGGLGRVDYRFAYARSGVSFIY